MEINVSFEGKKQVIADLGGFKVITDQPVTGGGEGVAPSPFALFLASLATCAGVYVQAFLESRGLPLTGVGLTQRHGFDPATHRLTEVELEIRVPADFPEKYHQAVIRAASQCAVKRALADPPAIAVNVVTA